MKTRSKILLVIAGIALLTGIIVIATGCSSAPTRVETRWFDIQTNTYPVVQVKTNIIPVTIVQTNYLVITNVSGVLEFRTNYVPILEYKTNVVSVTNTAEAYVYTPGAGARTIQETGAAVGNIFGIGGLVGTGLGALFSLWASLRSRKSYLTSANLAQTIETIRQFVRTLPNGQLYDNELVNWMQANQANAGVLQDVLKLLQSEVSNPDAQQAAATIHNLISALRSQQGATP